MSEQHEFSIEVLIHFRCARCRRCWTLSDLDDTTGRPWTCPRCEFTSEAIPLVSLEDDHARPVPQ